MSDYGEDDRTVPRWTQSLLARLAPPDRVDEVLGDLEEVHRDRAHRHGRFVASLVTALEALDVAVALLRERAERRASQRRRGARPFRNTPMWLDALSSDVRYTIRGLRAHPGFTAAVVATLMLGIGPTVAILSVVDRVMIHPLGYPEPGRLVRILLRDEQGAEVKVSTFDVREWREQGRSFTMISAYGTRLGALSGRDGDAEYVRRGLLGRELLSMIGARPLLGGLLTDVDSLSSKDALLVESVWRRSFGADPGIIGREVVVGGFPTIIRGVLPARFAFPIGAEIISPLDDRAPAGFPANARDRRWFDAVARLRDGVSIEQAATEIRAISRRLASDQPAVYAGLVAEVVGLEEYTTGDWRTRVLILMGGVGLVLLIAYANVANLLLVRGADRAREFALRSALGASRTRLARIVVCQSVLLSLVGAALGVGVATVLCRGLAVLMREGRPLLAVTQAPLLSDVRPGVAVVAMSVALALVIGIVAGLLPAIQATKVEPAHRIGTAGAGITRHAGTALRRALVVCQVALSVMLLVGAGLLTRTVMELRTADVGFQPGNLVTFGILKRIDMAEARAQTLTVDLLDRLRAVPGVEAVGAVSALPLSGWSATSTFVLELSDPSDTRAAPVAEFRFASEGYFVAMGMRTVKGHLPEPTTGATRTPVYVINETMARRYFAGVDPIGRRISPAVGVGEREIVAVVADAPQLTIVRKADPEVYRVGNDQDVYAVGEWVVRYSGASSNAILSGVRRALVEVEPSLKLIRARDGSELVSQSIGQPRLYTILVGVFGAVAIVLAAVGVYSLVSYAVRQRTSEIGIRMALGATNEQTIRLILGEGMVLALAGVILGGVGALWATQLLVSQLYGVGRTDPFTYVLVAASVLLVAITASYVPARRASRVAVVDALRSN